MVRFDDRREAGRKLADLLFKKNPRIGSSIILALPRGGVVVGYEIAKRLNIPQDLIVTRKIGSPLNPEYAIAAVSMHKIVLNPTEEIDQEYLAKETQKERQEIQRRMQEYRGNKSYPKIIGKTVILVDDGLATGLTMQVAIEEIKSYNPFKIIIAVPVAPSETLLKIKKIVDETVVLSVEPVFFSVGQFYRNFNQVTDKEVKELLHS